MDFEPVLATTLTNSSDPEVEAVGQVGQIVNTAKGSRPIMARGLHKFNLEQRRTSGASPEFSTKVRPSDSDKFSAPPASPIYTTGTITSTGLTNFGITTICAKHGSFSANNSNSQSSLNTPLNLNHAVGDGSLNTETNSMSVADGGMPRGVSSDTTGGSGSLTTTQSVGQVFFRLQARGSNPMPSSPAPGTSDCHDPNPNPQTGPNTNINLPFRFPPPSHSPSRSRTASFLPEEWRHPSSFSPLDVDLETGAGPGLDAISGPGTSPSPSFNSSSNGSYNPNLKFINVTSIKSFCEAARLFLSNTLPRLVYHNFLLLRFPAMYSSRAAMYSLRAARMVELDLNSQGGGGAGVNSANGAPFHGGSGRWVSGFSGHQGTSGVLGAAANGFDYWEAFINSLLKEWKTLNLVSALLIPTLLAILQIPEAADDLITRSTALLSLICALMSLSYGCIYIVRFGTMRSMYRASRWAEEARRTNTAIWWNVWMLLAMPAVSMAWSMLFFITFILSFIWLTGSGNDPSSRAPSSATAVLGTRVAITGVLVLGLVYLAMILNTLMKEWGEMRVDEMGTSLSAVSVQGEEPERRERGTRRRGGGADRHVEEEA